MNDQIRYNEFRNEVMAAMQKYGVQYKIFGGGAVTLVLDHRLTLDLDMAIKDDIENKMRFVDALVACGFGDKEYIDEHVRLLDDEESLENRVVQANQLNPFAKDWQNEGRNP